MKPTPIVYTVDGLEVILVVKTSGVIVRIKGSTLIACSSEEGKNHEIDVDVSLTVTHRSHSSTLNVVESMIQGQYPNARERGKEAAQHLINQILDLTDLCKELDKHGSDG